MHNASKAIIYLRDIALSRKPSFHVLLWELQKMKTNTLAHLQLTGTTSSTCIAVCATEYKIVLTYKSVIDLQ